MKKVGVVLGVLLVICFCLGFAAHAEEADAAGTLTGIWSVSENYGSGGTFTATWTFTPKSGIVYSLVAERPGGYVVDGIGIELGKKVIVKHPAYAGAGCKYTFKGTITGSTISGTALYKCSGVTQYTGTFTATKVSAAAEDEGEAEGSPDPE